MVVGGRDVAEEAKTFGIPAMARPRRTCFGEMVQLDGSHHAWLEDRGPKLVLMAYIDDATNTTYARFYDYEGTLPATDSFKGYVKKYGLPISVYLDRHTTYKSPRKPTEWDDAEDVEFLSQFERALKELGVEVIHAQSPQAKGRVERLLWCASGPTGQGDAVTGHQDER